MVEVTQEDREAAAKVAKMQSRYAKAANMKLGNCDTSPLVQLMARHRTTALAAKDEHIAALKASAKALMTEKHREAAEAKLWFEKAQEWKAELAAERAKVEKLREVLANLVEEYTMNVDSFRTGGFYTDPETEEVIIEARAALAETQP